MAKVIRPPKPFFSCHSPRQAPGNRVSIRPMLGTNSPTNREATASRPKVTANTSNSWTHRQRAPSTTPPRVVNTIATTRLWVCSG